MTSVVMTEIIGASLPNRSIGEGISALDIDRDGSEELLVFLATTTQPGAPSFNDVAVFRIGENLGLDPQFAMRGLDDPAAWPTVVHDQSQMPFSPSALQTSWLQDTRELDFNGDGVADLLLGDHGAEWPESGFEDYQSEDWPRLYETDPAFREGWPGGDVQIVLSGDTPEVVQITDERLFWHQTAAGDIDGDGDPDVITGAGNQVRLFLNDGQGNFSRTDAPVGEDEPESSPRNFSISNVEAADLDQDGVDELIIGPTAGRWLDAEPGLWVIEYDPISDRYQHERYRYPEVQDPRTGDRVDPDALISDKLSVGDYDNDGDPDLLVKLSNDDEGGHVGTFIYRNDGDDGLSVVDYEPADQVLGGDGGEFVDINGDGLLDIIYPGWPAGGSFDALLNLIFINQGDDRFTRAAELDTSPNIQFSEPHPANPDSHLSDFKIATIRGEPLLIANRHGEAFATSELLLASLQVFDRTIEGSGAIAGGDDSSLLIGSSDADVFSPGGAADRLLGGAGIDHVRIDGERADYVVAKRPIWDDLTNESIKGWAINATQNGDDNELASVERVTFNDKHLALDLEGAAGMAYRLYEASFDREPDAVGLGFWIKQLDGGMDIKAVAARFIDSAEFRERHGKDLTNEHFVETLYRNILDRASDQDGLDWWVSELDRGLRDQPNVLAAFSDSPENQFNVEAMIATGVEYQPWEDSALH